MTATARTPGTAVAFALLLAVAAAAWLPLSRCQFVFDDMPSIAENAALRGGRWLQAAYGEQHTPLANRPLTCLLLSAEFALFGDRATPFRVVSVMLHWLVAGLLFLVVRGALQLRAEPRAGWVALALAALWAAHPLAADAVAYATQQSTLLLAACLCGALLALLRAAAHPDRRGPWHAAVACTAAGMLAKEDMVVAPLVLLLFDRALLAGSWRALAPRRGLHVRLFACWLVLLASVLAGPHNPTVGYDTRPRATAAEWLQTQAGVVVHYARLALWPTDQRTCYDTPILREFGPAMLPGAIVLGLLALAIAWSVRRPWRGWPGLAAFLLLAPTSTILPIVTEVATERRAYLPMLALLLPVVLGAARLLRGRGRLAAALAAIAVVALTALARDRLAAYAGPLPFWRDAHEKNALTNRSFQAGTILGNYGLVLRHAGDTALADELFERAMQCAVVLPVDRVHRAVTLAERGELDEAEALLRRALGDDPTLADGHGNLATVLLERAARRGGGAPAAGDPLLAEALRHADEATRLEPRRVAFANTRAFALGLLGRGDEAVAEYRRAIAAAPGELRTYVHLARLLRDLGRGAEVQALWNALFATRPDDPGLRTDLAGLMLELGDLGAAEWLLGDAVRLRPEDAALRARLEDVRRRLGR
ncbi:MAG: hypothetical protein AB7O97_11740 [Planctomycetota bacterium]